MKEGVRFAFDGDGGDEDDMVLGSRFPFLLILSKYSNWEKKNKYGLEELKQFIAARGGELRLLGEHTEFQELSPHRKEDELR